MICQIATDMLNADITKSRLLQDLCRHLCSCHISAVTHAIIFPIGTIYIC